MFCKNCGKYIEYDSVYCDECKIKLEQTEQKDHYFDDTKTNSQSSFSQQPIKQVGSVKDGLKSGIIGLIMAIIAGAIIGYALVFMVYCAEFHFAEYLTFEDYFSIIEYIPPELVTLFEKMPYLSLIFGGISLPFSVIGLVFGVKSIKTFIKAKKDGRKKPIPTLVLGIFATYQSVVAIFSFFELICVFILIALI